MRGGAALRLDDPRRATDGGSRPAIRAILAAHGNDGPVVIADVVGPYLRHLIARGGAAVGDRRRRDRRLRGDDRRRAARSTSPTCSSTPIGSARESGGRCSRRYSRGAPIRTTFASEDPRALPLYIRAGMQPIWASLYLQGDASLAAVESASAVRTANPAESGAA